MLNLFSGDLFEREDDVINPNVWIDAGSEDSIQQRKNRLKIAELAHWIVPGHGPMFRVTQEIRQCLRKQLVLE